MGFKNVVLIGVAIISLLTGCASKPVVLPPVGPEPAAHGAVAPKSSTGYLQVFTATEKSAAIASDDNIFFNLHSGYDIQDQSGRNLQFVPNHASNMDEWPDRVALSAGTFDIVAESSCCGQVRVPVVIQANKTTVVHLDRNWSPPSNIAACSLVYLPDGEAVGWSSTTAEPSQ